MRLERGQKRKFGRFQGPKAPLLKMQEISKELKRELWKRRIGRTKTAFWGTFQRSVQEMPDAGEDHGHSEAVGGSDHVVVADRAARLNDGNRACFGGFFDAIGEWEKSV